MSGDEDPRLRVLRAAHETTSAVSELAAAAAELGETTSSERSRLAVGDVARAHFRLADTASNGEPLNVQIEVAMESLDTALHALRVAREAIREWDTNCDGLTTVRREKSGCQ